MIQPPSWVKASAEAEYVFIERLGVASDLGMPISRGSLAWVVAEAEAGRVIVPRVAEDALVQKGVPYAATFANALDSDLRFQVLAVGERFPGEPDWNAPYLTSKRPTTGGAP